MPKDTLIHIGYHKTGTTWMQRIYFQEMFGYTPLLDHKQVWDHIVDPHAFQFDIPAAKLAISAIAPDVPDDMVPVISSEILSGNPFYGSKNNMQYALRLRDLYPQGRILITIREQTRILASIYMQYIGRGGTKPPTEFFDEKSLPGYDHFSAEVFCYHHLVGYYRDLFGADRVLVLTQEEMAGNLSGFLQKVAAFSESRMQDGFPKSSKRETQSYPEYVYPVLRRINHFRQGPASQEAVVNLGRLSDFLYRGSGKAARIPFVQDKLKSRRPVYSFVRQKFGDRFSESNLQLERMLGAQIDMSTYSMQSDIKAA